ncbi:MAG: radical SAM protein [Candidatus Hydrothermarchaeota archaeon]|nr:radical SAM protein [Candidatus Hydrothermarchaeota archaeon]
MITYFDPWGDHFCTCPKKYSLNPYTGCEHRCVYCYITSYIPRGFECRLKKNLLMEVKKDRKKLNKKIPISMSNSSDPYTPMEREYKLTKACLKLLRDFKVLIVTKSDLVTRDIDLLKNMRASVSMTITTLEEEVAKKLEPFAPSPERRLRALEKLISNDIKVSCRIDPIIPHVNEDASALIKEFSDIGVSHVVASTFKARPDSWQRFENTFEKEAKELKRAYADKHKNAYYLPMQLRFKLLKNVRELCDKQRITFAACREGFNGLKTAKTCDGSHLIGA